MEAPPNPVAAALAAGETLVLDGGLATELEARGFDLADPLWSAKVLLEAPEAIEAVHLDYSAPAPASRPPRATRPRRPASRGEGSAAGRPSTSCA